MIEQKAIVTSIEADVIWVEAQRQSTCGQCQVRKGCGTGLLANHVGKRFSKIAVPKTVNVTVGQEVTVAIPEQALLHGAFLLYLVPLLLMFGFSALSRSFALGEGLEIVAGIAGLLFGFYWVRHYLKKTNTTINTQIIEDSI